MRGGDASRHRFSAQVGENFEDWVSTQHEMAGLRGALVHVVHNQASSKVVNGRLIYTAAGVADYTGVLHGGRYLAAEAKSTGKERLPRSEITPLQQAHLDAVTVAGGLAILLVEYRIENLARLRYAVEWSKVPWKMLRTAESVHMDDVLKVAGEPIVAGVDYLVKFHQGSSNTYNPNGRRRRSYPTE